MSTITIQKSEYKGVAKLMNTSSIKSKDFWRAEYKFEGRHWFATFDSEREAAIGYDKKMIELGKSPVNILKSTL